MTDRTHDLPVGRQAALLWLSRSSLYHEPQPVPEAELAIMRRIDALHLDHPFAGSRMLRDLLRGEGVVIDRKMVWAMMRRMCIEALYRRTNTSKSCREHKILEFADQCRHDNMQLVHWYRDKVMKRFFSTQDKTAESFVVQHSEDEWHRKLNPAQFQVLRKHGTERAGTSALNAEKRSGVFVCAGCGKPVFASDTKFESGTGWPSFYQPLEGSVGTTEDGSLFMTRTEVHCADCGGHLGHVFPDGPRPTGLRYCINGVAMKFRPKSVSE